MNNINVGRINGNALCGLCEKVCIRVDKVLDGCKCFFSGVREDNIPVAFSEGSTPTAPYNFVAVEGTGGVTAQNMTVSSADAGRLRISYNALFPVSITFTDAQNRSYYALGNISQPVSVVLKNPPVNQPYSVEITGRLVGKQGTLTAAGASFSCCIAIITALTVKSDIVLPVYGECVYPHCTAEEDECAALFNTPPFA